MNYPYYVEVWRGGAIESRHVIHVAVVDGTGQVRASTGDLEFSTFARSSVKPIQAIPLLQEGAADAFGFTSAEIALCCASHNGEPKHVELAAEMLRKIGESEPSLACGPEAPRFRPAAEALRRSGRPPTRLHNNCSGKHAGMIALAKHHGWPAAGYHEGQHPVQRRMLDAIAQWSDMPSSGIATAVDGCGVVTFAVPLRHLALCFARLAIAGGSAIEPAGRVVDAMRRHPDLIAGTGRLCTALAGATDGRVFAKVGAEGVYCAGVPAAGLGIALKVQDGAPRAAGPALLAVLAQLGFVTDHEGDALREWIEPEVHNTRREVVGRVKAVIQLI